MAAPTSYEEALRRASAAQRRMNEIYAHHELAEAAHRAHLDHMLRRYWWEIWKPTSPVIPLLPFDKAVEIRVINDPAHKIAASDVIWFLNWARSLAHTHQDQLRK